MRIDSNLALSTSFEVAGSSDFRQSDTVSSRLASYFEDGVDMTGIDQKKGDGGKITIRPGDSLEVQCENGKRPDIKQRPNGGYELTCPGENGKRAPKPGQKEPPPTTGTNDAPTSGPEGTPIIE